MATVVVGARESTGEVIVKDTETGQLSYAPGTPEQIATITEAIAAVPEYEAPKYEPYVEPSPGTESARFPTLTELAALGLAAAPAGAAAIVTGPVGWIAAAVSALQVGYTTVQTGALQRLISTLQSWKGSTDLLATTERITEQVAFITEGQQALTLLAGSAAKAIEDVAAGDLTLEGKLARATAIARAYGLSTSMAEELANTAVDTYEKAKADDLAKAKVIADTGDTTIATAAAMVGAYVPGLGTAATTGALSIAGLSTLIPTLAKSFSQASHQGTLACMPTTAQKLIQGITPMLIPAALWGLTSAFPELQAGLGNISKTVYEFLNKPLLDAAPITPDKAFGIAPQLLTQATMFGGAAHLAAITAEAHATTKHMGLGYLAAFLADMAGFSRIAAAYQGTLIQFALAQPMKYWALDKFRPMVPDPHLLMDMSLKREITDAQFNQGMAYAGFDEDWIKAFHRYKWRDPRLFEVLWIADVTRPDPTPPPAAVEWLTRANMTEWIGPDWWYAMKFAKGGYDPIDLPVLAKVTKRRTLATARTRRLFSTRQLYREGYITERFIREQFTDMEEPPASGEDWIIAERLERAYNLNQETKKLYLDQFIKGLIDEDDLRVALSTLIADPEMLQVTMQQAITRVTPKVAKDVAPEVKADLRAIQAKYVQGYTKLFALNQISDDTLFIYLVELGLDPELAEATVFAESTKKLPKVVAEIT